MKGAVRDRQLNTKEETKAEAETQDVARGII